MRKSKLNLYLEPDTIDRLRQYAYEHHMTASQAVTQWIWNTKVKYSNLPGQEKIDDIGFVYPLDDFE